MNFKKSLLAIVIAILLPNNTALASSNETKIAKLLLNVILNSPALISSEIDLFLIGAPQNYQHNFPVENYNDIKPGYEFNNFITFGDSISDQGFAGRHSMYVAGGFEKITYTDYLSRAYTGKISAPYSVGGMNFSQRGASLQKIQSNRTSVEEQVDLYLQRNNAQADPKSLYLIWGGAMDINIYLGSRIIDFFTGAYDINTAAFTLNNSPQVTADIAQKLFDSGAPYVFIPNIPDSTLLPYTTMLITEQIVENTIGRLNLPYNWIIKIVGNRVDTYLRNPANLVQLEGREFIRTNQINAMHSQIFWYLPRFVVANMYDWIANLQTRLTSQYNHSLNEALQGVKGNIIYFDFASLLNEVVYNYKEYHIDSVLVPTCTIGYSSRLCDPDSPEFHQGTYMFGDWFHPGPETHYALGQYIQSIFDAPVYTSSIARQLDNINLSREFFISNQLNLLRHQAEPQISKASLFIGYSGSTNTGGVYVDRNKTHSNILNIGIYSYINRHFLMGTALSLGFGKNKPHNNFNYKFNHQNIGFFTQYTFDNNLWLNFNLGVARLGAKDILRSTNLYKVTLHNTASTKAYSFNALFRTGIDIIKNETDYSGPLLEIGLNKFKVSGFNEAGHIATSMHYKNHRYIKNHVGLGWYYHNQALKIAENPLQVSFEATFNHELGKNRFFIPAAIKGAPVMFERRINNLNKQWLNIKVGGATKLTKAMTISGDLGYSTDFKRNKNINYSLGLNFKW